MLDTTRARERFGFTADVGLEDGLARTIAWWERQAALAAGLLVEKAANAGDATLGV